VAEASLLAGPIIRRAEPGRVFIWAATRDDVRLDAAIFGAEATLKANPRVLGLGTNTRKVRLGQRLWIHLVEVRPTASGGLPRGAILAYDLIDGASGASFARRPELCVGGFPLPSFVLQAPDQPLRALDGSCRKLHGDGDDALAEAGRYLARRRDIARRPDMRPAALFLGGDQIYADDVAALLIPRINDLGVELCGPPEQLPSAPPLARFAAPTPERLRKLFRAQPRLLRVMTGFTSDHGSNHLLGFSDWAALYVISWNPDVWPALPYPRTHEGQNLNRARNGLADVRRLLANVPTYMIFDDHEITDDWNLTDEWTRTVLKEKPIGRRAIANGLAAFWAFQAWGNEPSAFRPPFIEVVTQHLSPSVAITTEARQQAAEKFDRTLTEFHDWAFCAPTWPRALFLDTRTRRAAGEARHSLDPARRPPRLVSDDAWSDYKDLARRYGARPGAPLILIAPTPVYNVPLMEAGQELLASRSQTAFLGWDPESWRLNSRNMIDLFEFLADLAPSICVILSGDVHYASAGCALIGGRGKRIRVAQFTSSALKNAPGAVPAGAGLASTAFFRLLWWSDERGIRSASPPAHRRRGQKRPDFVESVRLETVGASSPGTRANVPVPGTPHGGGYTWTPQSVHPLSDREPIRVVTESNIGVLEAHSRAVQHKLLVSGGKEALPVRGYEFARWPIWPE
jgi:hypothetical protein